MRRFTARYAVMTTVLAAKSNDCNYDAEKNAVGVSVTELHRDPNLTVFLIVSFN